MTLLIVTLAAVLFIFGAIVGVLATLAVGIHTHSRTRHSASVPRTHIHATRQILGVGPLDETDHGKQ